MNEVKQTRRDFLRMAGKSALGAAVLTTLPSLSPSVLAEGIEAPEYPWKYQPVDKDVVLEHTYDCFFTHGGCGAAVVAGIFETMADAYGYPYNQINGRMFGTAGGGYGMQSLCGSLGAACFVLSVFAGGDAGALRTQLYDWYKVQEFPHYYRDIVPGTKTVSGSVECRDSVNKYLDANGFTFASDERKGRCAAVSAEVAVKVIELLNIQFGFEAAPVVEEAAPVAEGTAANEYIGVGMSEIGGEVKVKVTMDGDKIAKIDVISHGETAGISDPAFTGIPEAILKAQSTSVDAVSGATKTSEALIAAVNDALSQIKK